MKALSSWLESGIRLLQSLGGLGGACVTPPVAARPRLRGSAWGLRHEALRPDASQIVSETGSEQVGTDPELDGVLSPPRGDGLHRLACWLLLFGLAWFGYSVSLPARSDELARIEAAFGIRVERLKLAAGGHILDFRYRVLDSSKSAGLLQPGASTYLMPDKAPVRLDPIPLEPAAAPQALDRSGGENAALFGNPGRLLRRGDRVTLVLGGFRASGLTIQ